MNKKITVNLAVAIAIIAMTVTFVITMLLAMRLFDNTVSSVRAKEVMYNKIAEIDKSVRANYNGEINNDTLNDMLSAGYLAGLNDKNAVYYTAKQYLELQGVQSGRVIGIGADVAKDVSGYARIVRVYKNSTASEAAFAKNWFITRIADKDVKSLTQSQINSRLRGEEGTSVSLTVTDLTGAEHAVELQRRKYDAPSIEYSVPNGSEVGYLKIITFNTNTAKEVKAAADAMKAAAKPVQALVIDVRNNTGASLSDAMDVVNVLCPVGPIASQKNKDGSVKLLATSDNQELGLPVAVLVNANTSYGAELLAVSVRDFGIGRVVGVKTAGKGTVQCSPVALSDGSAIIYTIGTLLDKNGVSFDGTGVSPDVEIALKADEETNFYALTMETDPQIQRGFEAAEALLGQHGAQSGSAGSAASSSAAPAPSAPQPAAPASSAAAPAA